MRQSEPCKERRNFVILKDRTQQDGTPHKLHHHLTFMNVAGACVCVWMWAQMRAGIQGSPILLDGCPVSLRHVWPRLLSSRTISIHHPAQLFIWDEDLNWGPHDYRANFTDWPFSPGPSHMVVLSLPNDGALQYNPIHRVNPQLCSNF